MSTYQNISPCGNERERIDGITLKHIRNTNARMLYDGECINNSEYVALFSYDTLIAIYQKRGSTLFVNYDYYNFSATTIRHLSSWLNQMQIGVSYHDIKKWHSIIDCNGEIHDLALYRELYNYQTCIMWANFKHPWSLGFFANMPDYAIKDEILHVFNVGICNFA